jgi:uncharacterized delta-60 repeat protein
MSFDKEIDTNPIDYYQVRVNGELRERTYDDVTEFYSTYIFTGDTVNILLTTNGQAYYDLSVYRRDYTTDDQNGDNGIRDTFITAQQLNYGSTSLSVTFTASTSSDTYNFEYRIGIGSCFDSGTGFDGITRDIEIKNDYIYVDGSYTQYNGISKNQFARLYSSGALDTGFTLNLPAQVSSISDFIIQSDNKIITMCFASVAPSGRLFRFNSNGSIDGTFYSGSTNTSFSSDEVVALQSDGKILVGGSYSGYTVTGTTYTRNGLVRLNTDGSIDSTFNIGTGFANSVTGIHQIIEVEVLSNGKILVGGSFDSYNGTPVGGGILRLNSDGSLDTTFITTSSANTNVIREILVLSNGKVILGGSSNLTFNGINKGNVVRLNPDGGYDNTFLSNISGGTVNALALNSDGTILVGGINFSNPTITNANLAFNMAD